MDKQKGTKNISWRKLIVLISVFIVLILFPIVLYLYFSKSPEGVAWMNSDWTYRKSISVSNSGSELTNEDVLVTIDTESLINASKLQSDCDDLRFTDSDESTALDYWVEGGCDTTTTRVWVQIPTLPSGGKTIYVYYGNSGAANAEETWSGVFISLYDAACPTGWTRDTNFDSKFPYGAATAGTTGGSTSHTHGNYSGGTSSNGTNSYATSGGSTAIAPAHNHSYSLATNTNSTVWPPYLNMIFCDNSKYDPFTGMITMFVDTLPDGWSFFIPLGSVGTPKFPRGASSYGATGGDVVHTHTYGAGATGSCGTGGNFYGSGMPAGAAYHTHSWSAGNLADADNMPPYIQVAWAYSAAASVVDEAIFMVTENPPLGWSAQSQYNGYFFRGATTNLGTTAGASTHTHSKNISTGGGSSVTISYGTSNGGSAAGHDFTITTDAQSNIPPYYTVIVSKRKISQSTSLGAEQIPGPATPTIGTPSALSTTSIRWNFTDNSSDELGFKVYSSDKDCTPPPPCPDPFGDEELMVTCDTPNISYCDETGLSPNTEYTRKVLAYNNVGESSFTNTASVYTLMSTPTISYGGNKTVSSIYLQSSDAINGSEMYFDCTGTGCDTGLNTWVASTNALAEGLSSNSAYNFRVKSRNGDNVETDYSSTAEIYTLADIPGLELNAVGSTSMQVTGDINNVGVGSTALYFDCTGLNCDTGINTWSTTASQTVTNLLPNTQYAFIVKGRNYDGVETEYSESLSKYTLTDIPTVTGEAVNTTSILLESSTDNIEYGSTGLYFDCTDTGCDTGINEWLKDTEDTVTGLSPNTGYTFVTKARNADAVESSNSDSVDVYTLAQVPSITFGEILTTSISIQATDVDNLATGNSGIYIDCTGTNCDSGINEWLKSDTDVAINLSPSTQYTFQVKARNYDGIETAYGTTQSIYTAALTPSAPEILSSSTQAITIRVKSDSNPSSTRYAILEETTNKYVDYNTNALVSSPVWGTRVQFGSDTGTLINGLSTGVAYSFKVKAKNTEDLETSYGSSTNTATLLVAPTAGLASNITTSSITWNFTDTNSNEAGVRVYNEYNQLITECSGSNISSCTESNLSPNVTYRRYIKAYNTVSNSNYSGVITVTTLAQSTAIQSIVNNTSNSVVITLSPVAASYVQIYEPNRAVYFNSSLGVLSSIATSVSYARSITVEGLLPNTLYTFRVKSANASGVDTQWSSTQSITTFAQVPSIVNIGRISSDVVRVYINNLSNPNNTEFSIKEINGNRYLDYQTNTLVTGEKWGTFEQFGGTNGLLVNNIDPSIQYGFAVRARNSEGSVTSLSTPQYIGTKAILYNVSEDIKVTLAKDEKVIPTQPSNALYGEQEIRVKSGEYIVADVPVLFSTDRDWGQVVIDADVENGKTVVKFNSTAGVEKPFTMYVVQGDTNSLIVCPNATTIEQISVTCDSGVKFIGEFPQTKEVEGRNVSVSQVILGGVKYWVADGLVGTGAQGYISQPGEEEEEEEKQKPVITFKPVVDAINNVVESVKGTTLSILDSTPIKDLEESELKNISVATSVVTVVVSTGVVLGSLPQMVYLFIQTVFGALSALGFRRKRMYYGYVYDSYSKAPLDSAIVRIYSTEKSLVETAITDSTGKFFGNLPEGEYTLEVRKRGYTFPSQYIKGEDYPIQNVYKGSINISGDKSDLEVAIPMDREELGSSGKTLMVLKKIFIGLLSALNVLVFVGGIVIFVYMYSKYPNAGNLLIGLIYIPAIYFLGRSFFGKYANYGKVVDAKGKGVDGIAVVLKDKEFNRIVSKRVTDEKGRYRFVVNKGVYIIDIDERKYSVEKIQKGEEIDVRKNNGIIARKIVVKNS